MTRVGWNLAHRRRLGQPGYTRSRGGRSTPPAGMGGHRWVGALAIDHKKDLNFTGS